MQKRANDDDEDDDDDYDVNDVDGETQLTFSLKCPRHFEAFHSRTASETHLFKTEH